MKFLFVLLLSVAAASADKIVGGTATEAPIPYQARLQYDTGSIRCGGSLISSLWVLSAAHCQGARIQWKTWSVALGYYDGTGNSIQMFSIEDQIPNPTYDSATTDNDVMLLRLSGPATMVDGVVGTIDLPDQLDSTSYPPVGTPCLVSGWGTTSSGGSISTELRSVEVYVVDQDYCGSRPGYGITPGMMCLAADGKDSCQGDSGGPAVCNTGTGPILNGIVSWGMGCAAPRYPGVYTRVSVYVNWIYENMQ